MTSVPSRQDVPVESTWDHESVFLSFDAWREEYQAAIAALTDIESYKDTLSTGPARLAEWFEFSSGLARRVWKVYMYPALWQECDGNHEAIKGMVGQAQGLVGQYMAAAAFADPELLAMDRGTLLQWTSEEEALKLYHHYISNLLRTQKHVLSAEVEAALGMLSEPLGRVESIRNALTNMDMRFAPARSSAGETLPVVQSTRDKLLADSDRQVRKTTWNNYADRFLEMNKYLGGGLSGLGQAQCGDGASARL